MHNLQGVGGRAGAEAQAVIEDHAPGVDLLTEMQVAHLGPVVRQMDQLEVMGGNYPDTIGTHQYRKLSFLKPEGQITK